MVLLLFSYLQSCGTSVLSSRISPKICSAPLTINLECISLSAVMEVRLGLGSISELIRLPGKLSGFFELGSPGQKPISLLGNKLDTESTEYSVMGVWILECT